MSGLAAWRRPLAVTALVIVLVEVMMLLLDMGPSTLLVAALGAFTGSAVWSLRSLRGTASFTEPPRAAASGSEAGTDACVRTLRSEVLGMQSVHSSERLHRTLVALIDDELERSHGISRRDDPAAAERIIGPQLSAFAMRPESASSMSETAELDRIVTLIEQL